MSEHQTARPTVFREPISAGARALEAAIAATGHFDAAAWHVMDERDNRLIEEELLHGVKSRKFVYVLPGTKGEDGKPISGISVIGAQELASKYHGIKHRIIASTHKVGTLFTFKSYPINGGAQDLTVKNIPELAGEPDFYEVVIEIEDVKTGNTRQVEKREARIGTRSARTGGGINIKEHYQTIALSKAFRNGVLAIIPQGFRLQWQNEMLAHGDSDDITSSVLDARRDAVIAYAAKRAIPVDRLAVERLTMAQMDGLHAAATEDRKEGFERSAEVLGVLRTSGPAEGEGGATIQQMRRSAPRQEPKRAPDARDPRNEQQQNKETEAPPQPFEAYLVNSDGEVIADVFTDRGKFADAWAEEMDHTAPELRQAVFENNEETLELAKQDPEAAKVINAAIDWFRSGGPNVRGPRAPAPAKQFVALEPPVERGRVSWVSWKGMVQGALGGLSASELLPWLNAQRPTLERATGSPLALAIKAINDRAIELKVQPQLPPWLPQLLMPKRKPKEPDAQQQAEQQRPEDHPRTAGANEPAKPDADARWIADRRAEIGEIKSKSDLKAYCDGTLFQTGKERIQASRRDLIQQLDELHFYIAERSEKLSLGLEPRPA